MGKPCTAEAVTKLESQLRKWSEPHLESREAA